MSIRPGQVDKSVVNKDFLTTAMNQYETTSSEIYAREFVDSLMLFNTTPAYLTHSTFGDTACAAAGPGLWNRLPPHLRDADLPYSRFQWSLKTFLFV